MKKTTKIFIIILIFIINLIIFILGIKKGLKIIPILNKDIIKIVNQEAKNFNLDPLLIQAIIITESKGEIHSISHKGAIGLMQIMPTTAYYLAKKLNIKIDKEKLKDPRYNIRLGSYYIYLLLRKFNGDIILTLASYNTGPTRVKRWLKKSRKTNISSYKLIYLNGSTQTIVFVNRVLRYYNILKNNSFNKIYSN